ncbi:MAG: metallophosphoesterase [Marinibacterium sp.]
MILWWVLGGLLALLAGLFLAFYMFILVPVAMLRIRHWTVRRGDWPAPMKIAILTDLHMGDPWVPLTRLRNIVTTTNGLGADLIVILGDLTPGHRYVRKISEKAVAAELAALEAPLGVLAILGNHDWWEDSVAQSRGAGPVVTGQELEAAGIPVLENAVHTLPNGVVVAGLGDQLAFEDYHGDDHRGVDDLPGTLAQIPEGAPAILLAHEPDIFPQVPDRIALTLSGHTHGGQIRLLGWSPVVPSQFGNRYAYGHVREGGRDLVISGGIGCSILPVRLGVAPEITLVTLTA